MKHLLTAAMSRDEAIELLDLAEDMHQIQDREVKKLPALRGRTVVNLFFEDSTRTRSSFEIAGKWLSADVINVSGKGSSASKGESLRDTGLTIAAMGVDGVVVRSGASGAPALLAEWIGLPVVNAGDGTHEHPTQALLDAFALRRRIHGEAARGKGLDGVRVAIVGDIAHSRVARSNALLLPALGAEVTLVGPPSLLPLAAADGSRLGVRAETSLDRVLAEQPDALMLLRVQLERQAGKVAPSVAEYITGWSLTDERLARIPDTRIMHPGPMNRGLELSSRAADGDASTVLEQVTAGVSVRMAVLYALLASDQGGTR
ncbi:aspartate carbamoyltransferase catalytic subunit [Agrococcus sp. ARC_14]|uniref:aspartate carbamoyltransferase catalytic subunit n=1 Tax=Agrococcus sp. ARC_14 TaxID=2919927 RepID=UPI001F05C6C0|nr:aspartate carbamoyltransferase catalytic subunit [Agrococcus sp. ARC_14]MCH1883088.1 aspartate carbamoyltransferase catalytic subunit [Agrococcus sp. ARC_14]